MPACSLLRRSPTPACLWPRCLSRAASYSLLRLSSLRLVSFTSAVSLMKSWLSRSHSTTSVWVRSRSWKDASCKWRQAAWCGS